MDSAQGTVATELEQARTTPYFGAHTPLSEKLLAVAIRAQNFTGSSGIAIALMEGQEIICRANWGTSAPELGSRLSLEHSFTGLCVRTGEPLRCDDAESDPRVDGEACRALGINAIAAAPVRRGLKVIGVIAAFSDTPNAFTDKHLLILATLSDVIVEILDDPHPVEPLPQVVETAPDPARAAAVAQMPVALGERAAVTEVGREPAPAEAGPVATLGQSEPPVEAALAAPIETTSPGPQKAAAAVMPSFTTTLASTTPSKAPRPATAHDSASHPFEASWGKNEILPAAMDPGPSLQQLKGPTRIAPAKQPAATSSADFAAADTLTFAGLEASSSPYRRWLLAAVVLVTLAVFAAAGWRWHSARSASMAPPPAAPASETQSNQPPESAQEPKPPEAASTAAQPSPFSPLPMATMPPAKTKPAAAPPADVTIRHGPQPVVEGAGLVRRAAATGISGAAQAPEAQAPQLALSTPDLPAVVVKPATAAVAAPVSRVFTAQLLRRVEPVYPESARRLRISGKVMVRATVTKAGTVSNVRWMSGNDLFRDTTLAAVKQWRYKPASLNGQPVESDLEIVLQFSRPSD